MNIERSHIIKKLVIDLQVSDLIESERERFTQKIKSGILEGLEQAGRQLDLIENNQTYRFDEINMDISLEMAEAKDVGEIVEARLLSAVKDLKEGIKSVGDKVSAEPNEKQSTESINHSKAEAKVENEIALNSEKRMDSLFFFFIQTGQFPWWAGKDENLKSLEAWLQKLNTDEWQKILKERTKKDKAVLINRLTAQFPESLQYDLLKKSGLSPSGLVFTRELVKDLLQFIEEGDFKLPYGQIETINIKLLRAVWQTSISSLTESKDLNFVKVFSDFSAVVFDEIARYKAKENVRAKWEKHLNKEGRKEWLDLESKRLSHKENKPKLIQKAEKSKPIAEFDVPQAGLVLLQPFISGLLQNLGLIQEGDFHNEDLRERAVCVLHYLATGEEDFTEHKLGLPMFLCSWPLGKPVSRFLILSDYEKEECNNVLLSALNHWTALKSTSPAGLIGSYLCREGRLHEEAFGWTLYVEKKSWDILLDKLPWGFHVVKYKWMEKILTVNWNY